MPMKNEPVTWGEFGRYAERWTDAEQALKNMMSQIDSLDRETSRFARILLGDTDKGDPPLYEFLKQIQSNVDQLRTQLINFEERTKQAARLAELNQIKIAEAERRLAEREQQVSRLVPQVTFATGLIVVAILLNLYAVYFN